MRTLRALTSLVLSSSPSATVARSAAAMAILSGTVASIACGHSDGSSGGGSTGDDSSVTPSAPTDGLGMVRGLSGINPAGVGATTDEDVKHYAAVVDDLAAQMQADNATEFAAQTANMLSGDATRIATGKAWFDATIASTATEAAFTARLNADMTLNSESLALHPLGLVTANDAGLVKDGGMLVCSLNNSDGGAIHLGAVNGRYGDSRTGFSGANADLPDLACPEGLFTCKSTLAKVDNGTLSPDPSSRLGAYAATKGYPVGTVGNAVHNAIGTIFLVYSNYGQEEIGRVFNSPQAKALFPQQVSSCAGLTMASLEYQYWSDVHKEDPYSPGGNLGTDFNPTARNLLQNYVFNR